MDADKKIKDDQLALAPISEEPKVIAEIQIRALPLEQEQYLYEYHTCCLCGTEMTFSHVTHFVRNEVEEEAYCYSCNIRTKKETHGLH